MSDDGLVSTRTLVPAGALVSMLAVGLAACGGGAGTPGEPREAAAAEGASAVSAPDPEELLAPAPEDARFEAGLTASARRHLEAIGGQQRRTGGTGGSYEGRNFRTYIFSTDRSLEQVLEHYAPVVNPADRMHGGVRIREEALSMGEPDELERAVKEYGVTLPPGFLERYRQAYPRIAGATGSYAEIALSNRRPDVERYEDVRIRISRPYFDPGEIEVHDRTAIHYTVTTMERTDGP